MRMKWKDYEVVLFVACSICINFFGKWFAQFFELPLWMDCIGTIFVAYVLGPVCGGIVGVAVNLIYGVIDPVATVYVITNVLVGVAAGLCAKFGLFQRPFKTFSTGMILALISTASSVLLNYKLYGGMTGNLWGDGVIHYFMEARWSPIFCYCVGEFYIDLVDKLFSVFLVYLFAKWQEKKDEKLLQKVETGITGLVLAFSFFAAQPVYGQDEINFDSSVKTIYNQTNGIPGGEVNDLKQTPDGMLWLGTYSGLYQYDGNNFSFMKQFESVRNVNCLYNDEEGRLWIGTNDSGLSICSQSEIVNVLDEEGGLPSNSVRSIIKNMQGICYIGTADSLALVTLTDGLHVLSIVDQLKYVMSLSASKQGYVCAVTEGGKIGLLQNEELLQIHSGADRSVMYTSVQFDAEGYLYAGTTQNTIEKFEIVNQKLKLINILECGQLKNINEIYITEQGKMFVCADNGIGYFRQKDLQYADIKCSQFNSSIDGMLMDYQGNYWFCSSRLGLLKICESVFEEVYAKANLKEQVVNVMVRWKNLYYFGTDHGLNAVDTTMEHGITKKWMKEFEDVRIRCMKVDKKNHLWIATSGEGVYEVFEDESMHRYDVAGGLICDKTRVLCELSNGAMAVATDDGISFIRNGRIYANIGYKEGMDTAKVLCLYEKDGYLYAGTDGGGIAVIKDGRLERQICRKDGLGSDIVLRIVECLNGKGAFIITSNGLNYMDKYENVRILKKFPYYNNFDLILTSDGKAWVTGSAGIYVVDEKMLRVDENMEYELIDAGEGLQQNLTANSWNYVDEDENLYLCGNAGVVKMDRSRYDQLKSSYRITLSSVALDGVAVDVDKEEMNSIPRNTSRIEFFPKVINFSVSDPYVRVWLKGFDEKPLIVRQSKLETMAYTNLPAGNYVFYLAILDNRKENVIEEIQYSFVKEKEIHDNKWFILYLIFVLGIFMFYVVWIMVGSQINKSLLIQKKELENLKLKQTADAALAAGEAKDQFLALMSHDLRTPINAILGMNEMILRESTEQQIYEYAMDIRGAGNTLLTLVNGILDFSKIEEGKMEIVPVEYDTAMLFHNLVSGVSTRAKDKGLDFQVDVNPKLPSILYGDDVRLNQVISNLLTNAVKYTQKGYIRLTVREQERKGNVCVLYVEVKDSGMGIKKEDMGKLFESFQRLDEQKNRHIEGTGLGMSIVTKLLALMGSKLEVESEYGVGSSFWFTIEQNIVSEEFMGELTSGRNTVSDERSKEKHIWAPKAKILVVDDNDMNRKVATHLLKINGIVPDTASSGKQAIKLVKKNRYDLIFMDHMMPEMDGIETLEVLKERHLLSEKTKVIVLTANAINGAREQYIKSGFDDYLSKPMEVIALENKLKKYLPEEIVFPEKPSQEELEMSYLEEEINEDDDARTRLRKMCPEIDIETGIKYCVDSWDFFIEMLKDFCSQSKKESLEEYIGNQDYENYRILVHALKGTSLSVGAVKLSDHARELEFAARDLNIDYIQEHHGAFMKEYQSLLNRLKKYFNQEEGK